MASSAAGGLRRFSHRLRAPPLRDDGPPMTTATAAQEKDFSLGYRGGLFDEGDNETGLIDVVDNEKRPAYNVFKRG